MVTWIQTVPATDLFLSVITIGEIELGIEKQRGPNPAFADELNDWLELTLRVYDDRVLPLGVEAARRWRRLAARLGNRGLGTSSHVFAVVTRSAHLRRKAEVAREVQRPRS